MAAGRVPVAEAVAVMDDEAKATAVRDDLVDGMITSSAWPTLDVNLAA